MPATRSSGISRRTPSAQSSSLAGPSTSSSFIEVAAPPFQTTRSGHSNHAKQKKKPMPFIAGEVIEISSDEEEEVPIRRTVAKTSSNPDLRKELRTLKDSNASLKSQLQSLKRDLEDQKEKTRAADAQHKKRRVQSEIVLDSQEIESIISCDVCEDPMLVPYILPGCGHTFCQKCLTDWFDTTYRNFLVAHPHYNPNNPLPAIPHLAYVLNQPHLMNHPAFAQLFGPQPEYTCPGCRTPVKSPPVENFGMKALARMCHTVNNGRAPPSPAKPRTSPWDGFFPRR